MSINNNNQNKLKYIKTKIKIITNQKRKYYFKNYSKIYNQKMTGKY